MRHRALLLEAFCGGALRISGNPWAYALRVHGLVRVKPGAEPGLCDRFWKNPG